MQTWSHRDFLLQFETWSMALSNENLELAVYGYIKELKLSSNIPDLIKDVIVQFAKYYSNWKNSEYAKDSYESNEEDPTRLIRLKSNRGWLFLAMHDVLSLDVCKTVQWELQIIERIDEKLAFMFGFVESLIEESIKDWEDYLGHDHLTEDK